MKNGDWLNIDSVKWIIQEGTLIKIGMIDGSISSINNQTVSLASKYRDLIARHINQCKVYELMMNGVCQDPSVLSEDITKQHQDLSIGLGVKNA